MKLSMLQSNLNKALKTVMPAVAARSTLPICSNVLLETDAGRVKLTATDLEIAITAWCGGKIEAEGAITVPARLFSEAINALPDEEIDIEVNGSMLAVTCGRAASKLPTVTAKDFPPVPGVKGQSFEIEAIALAEAIGMTEYAVAREESRPVLTGISLKAKDGKLSFATADGFRLVVYTMGCHAESFDVIIPGNTLSRVKAVIGKHEKPVAITLNQNVIKFTLDDTEIISQQIAGSFPQYEALIPTSHNTSVTVSASELLRVIKSASIFAKPDSLRGRTVRLQAANGRLTVSAQSEEFGQHVNEIDAEIDGEDSKIAFNGNYLVGLLSSLKEDRVVMETTNPSSPAVFRAVGRDNYLQVIMPMFTQW